MAWMCWVLGILSVLRDLLEWWGLGTHLPAGVAGVYILRWSTILLRRPISRDSAGPETAAHG
jgi:hypothetical protein